MRRLPHAGQYTELRPSSGCQPQRLHSSGFSAPQLVQKLPSFSVRQAGQLHAADGGACGWSEKITSSSPHAASSLVSHLWPLPSLYRIRKAFYAWLNVRPSKVPVMRIPFCSCVSFTVPVLYTHISA